MSSNKYPVTYTKMHKDFRDPSKVDHVEVHHANIDFGDNKPTTAERVRHLVANSPEHKALKAKGYTLDAYGDHKKPDNFYTYPVKITKQDSIDENLASGKSSGNPALKRNAVDAIMNNYNKKLISRGTAETQLKSAGIVSDDEIKSILMSKKITELNQSDLKTSATKQLKMSSRFRESVMQESITLDENRYIVRSMDGIEKAFPSLYGAAEQWKNSFRRKAKPKVPTAPKGPTPKQISKQIAQRAAELEMEVAAGEAFPDGDPRDIIIPWIKSQLRKANLPEIRDGIDLDHYVYDIWELAQRLFKKHHGTTFDGYLSDLWDQQAGDNPEGVTKGQTNPWKTNESVSSVYTEDANRIAQLQMATNQAKQITKAIKYDKTVHGILVKIELLGEKYGIDKGQLGYAEDEVREAMSKLESAVYELDQVFAAALQDAEYAEEDANYVVDETMAVNRNDGAGRRWYDPEPAGADEVNEYGTAQSYRKFTPKVAGTFKKESSIMKGIQNEGKIK